jgi:hypothetical protein
MAQSFNIRKYYHRGYLTDTVNKAPLNKLIINQSCFRETAPITNSLWHMKLHNVEVGYIRNLEYYRPRSTPQKHYFSLRGNVVVEALCYMKEGSGFETEWGEINFGSVR